MALTLEQILEDRKSRLALSLKALSAEALDRYHQWLADDAGTDLIGFMPEMDSDIKYDRLVEICNALQECSVLAYELKVLRENAAVGQKFRELVVEVNR